MAGEDFSLTAPPYPPTTVNVPQRCSGREHTGSPSLAVSPWLQGNPAILPLTHSPFPRASRGEMASGLKWRFPSLAEIQCPELTGGHGRRQEDP